MVKPQHHNIQPKVIRIINYNYNDYKERNEECHNFHMNGGIFLYFLPIWIRRTGNKDIVLVKIMILFTVPLYTNHFLAISYFFSKTDGHPESKYQQKKERWPKHCLKKKFILCTLTVSARSNKSQVVKWKNQNSIHKWVMNINRRQKMNVNANPWISLSPRSQRQMMSIWKRTIFAKNE